MSSPRSSSEPRRSSVFDRLHPGVQRWIWEQGWKELRPIQERAAEPILAGSSDVIIAAATAGGKTEAAFLPIVSRLAEAEPTSVGCLCVSPLKALINDQFDRLTPLCERAALPLTPWHGDVAPRHKRELLRERAGVLLITPESLEAFFVLRGSQLPELFRELRYVVVDELHTFIGSERGRQLQSLLHRVELAVRRRVPRVALSATLGDMELAAEALRPGGGAEVMRIEGEREGREMRMQLRGYKRRRPTPSRDRDPEGGDDRDAARLSEDLFDALRGSDNLVFANSRGRVEKLTDGLRRLCEDRGVPSEFYPHHGNLSREIREEAEQRVKDPSRPTTVLCTTTLELGIDVGHVASVAQLGSPPSVAALRQRLGRSGRRGAAPAVLRLFATEAELDENSHLVDELRVQLVQSIAMVELLLARWCEPPAAGQLHLSTLVQQLLSVVAQHGGASAEDLYGALCQSGPFREIDRGVFARLLRGLGEAQLLTQLGDGALALGVRGEELVDHYTFFAAFATPDEYRLVTGSWTLGTVPISKPLEEGSYLIFAGRRWKVLHVDEESRLIEVAPAKAGSVPYFPGDGFDVHDRVREKMRELYRSDRVPVYLDGVARRLFAEGRAAFRRLGLVERRVVERGGGALYLFPWRSDRVLHTLELQLRARELDASLEGIAIQIGKAEPEKLRQAFGEIARGDGPSGPELAERVGNQLEAKYDWTLRPDLRCLDYASRHFDEGGARETAAALREAYDGK